MEKVIELTVAGIDLVFRPNETAYSKFVNDVSMTDKVAPTKAYIKRIVDKDYRDALAKVLDMSPNAAMQLTGIINEQYAPALTIELKN